MSENRSVYVTLGFAGVALMVAMIIGMVVLKKRNGRHPHHQLVSVQTTKVGKTKEGFIEVDTAASPEEKHVASMQINGYENPTYKYFEASTA
jgi:amyloid beta A4 protein